MGLVEPLIVLFLIFIYFIPSTIASYRGKKNILAIFLINLFFGWTFVGWVGALIWAVIHEKSDKPYGERKKEYHKRKKKK